MITLKINNIEVAVNAGATILDAAKMAGVKIPAMCHHEGFEHNNSCMLCLVKNNNTGRILPSCSAKAESGMDIDTSAAEIIEARKTGLELLLSDHIGDCEAPCTLSCPANMDIPLMNRLIANEKFTEALICVKQHIALPAILGYICPAPCEKGCKRKTIDNSISICRLKRFVAENDLNSALPFIPAKEKASGQNVAIIGAGATGLSAAYYLLQMGHACTIYDKNPDAGGALRYHISNNVLPRNVLDSEIGIIEKLGAVFVTNTAIDDSYYHKNIHKKYNAVVIATGTDGFLNLPFEKSKTGIHINHKTFETSINGIFAGGNAIKESKMAVRSVAHGKAIAHSVGQYLQHVPVTGSHANFNSMFGALQPIEFDEYLKETSSNTHIHKETHLENFSSLEAQTEAQRCMHCDCRKKNNCQLRNYAAEYKANRHTYWPVTRKTVRKKVQQGIVIYEPEKCIKCNICIQITTKAGESIGLTHVGRGFDIEVCVPFNNTIDEGLKNTALECIKHCPTGALANFKE